MTHRYLTNFKGGGTRSFRLAAAKLFDFGGNAQNPPKAFLRCWTADQGKLLVQVDQAGAEALIVAYMASRGRFRDLFLNKVKPHTYVAGHVFSSKFTQFKDKWYIIPAAELVADPEWPAVRTFIQEESKYEYDLGKKICHAANYKMGPVTMRDNIIKETDGQVVLTIKDTKGFLAIYATLFPEVIAWQAEVIARARRDRVLYNLQGFPLRLERNWNDGYEREAVSKIPQSTVACITHNAAIEVQQRIIRERLAWDLLNNKHDSVMVQAPEAEAMEAAKYLYDLMRPRLIGWDGTEFQMGAEASIGRNWGKWSEKNPEGMKAIKL